MNISIRQLQIFEAVAITQSFTRAAERLYMTQPAISMQIKQLEGEVGFSLFEKQGRKIVMTERGQSVRVYVNEVMMQYDSMKSSIAKLKNSRQHHIKISAATTANHFITQLLAEFGRQHQDIQITLDITNRQTLVSQLQNYEPDFVIMGEPPSKVDLLSQQIMINPLVVISSPEHVLASNTKKIAMQDIVKESFVVREEGSGTKATIRRHFRSHNYEFVSSFEMGSNESIKHAVVAGLGLGIVSLHTIKLELEARKLVILDVENFPLERYWNLVSRKGKKLSPAAIDFRDFILESATSYQQGYSHITPF